MSQPRNVYLRMKSLEEARQIVLDTFASTCGLCHEVLPTPEGVGRILSRPLMARLSVPHFHAAAMDGIAVAARATFGAHESRPRELRLGLEACYVNTGHVLPEGCDAVIMIEHVQVLDDNLVRIEAPAHPWQHVRKMGEDIVASEMLFARHHQITPYCLGALLSAGHFEVPVFCRPRVVIIPTGSELVDWRKTGVRELRPGEVIQSNAYVLAALVRAAGGRSVQWDHVGDDPLAIQAAIEKALDQSAQAVLLTGGSSAGSEDYAHGAIAAIGDVLVHGVTMMPGKPALVGNVGKRPVFGIPGYPVSAIMAFEQLVQPLLARWLGQPAPRRQRVAVRPTRKIASRLGVEEFVRVKIGRVGGTLVAATLPRGAGQVTSITEADGIIRIPAHVEGVGTDATVKAELLRPPQAIDRTIVAVGSHDNTLDLLADELHAQGTHLSLSSSHVGSIGGLMAIKRGVCHLAGTHLLDAHDGTYNISYIHKYLKAMDLRLVHLVMRDQGLMVPPGNPKKIKGLEDLAREDVRLINRQAGSGTRILLDYSLARLGLETRLIDGYHNEEFTHMAVAVAVLGGAADVGLGIYAAAKALGLDFIPVVTEQYDLVIPAAYYATEALKSLLAVINSAGFQKRVSGLGGYDTQRTGEVLM